MSSSRFEQKNAGLSLVEFLATLMLLAIFASAISGILSSAKYRETSLVANSLMNIISNVKREVKISGRQQKITIDSTGRKLASEREEYNVDSSYSLKAVGLPNNGGIAIWFYPDGSTSGGSIEIGNDKEKILLYINWYTGRVESESI